MPRTRKGSATLVYFVERFIFDGLMLPGVLPIDPIQTMAWTPSFEAAFYLLVASTAAAGMADRHHLIGSLNGI
jgi:hypothetical protein